MHEELLLNDAIMGVYNAIEAGWNETEDWTTSTPERGVVTIDLPHTAQTIRLTVEITPGTAP